MENCEAMTSSTHSFAYSYRLVKKSFLKIGETSKYHNFLIFQPIFIKFSLFCKFFVYSFFIKLNLFRIFPLKPDTVVICEPAAWGLVFQCRFRPAHFHTLFRKMRIKRAQRVRAKFEIGVDAKPCLLALWTHPFRIWRNNVWEEDWGSSIERLVSVLQTRSSRTVGFRL